MNKEKEYFSLEQRIDNLVKKGIIRENQKEDDNVKKTLKSINYFKLKPYIKDYELKYLDYDVNGFQAVISMYEFDRELRSLLMKVIEIVEVSIKTFIIDFLYLEKRDNNCLIDYLQENNNGEDKDFQNMMKRLTRKIKQFNYNVKTYTEKSHTNNVSSDKFTKEDIKEIKNYHSDKPLPIWVVIEQLTFGEVTQILRFLNKNELRKIFKSIGEIDYSPIKVPAALNGVRYVRNLCSHNEKLINRTFKYSMPESTEPSLNNRVGLIKYLLFIKKIVKKYDPSSWRGFCEDLDSLIMNSKYISEKDLLFKSGYIEEYLK